MGGTRSHSRLPRGFAPLDDTELSSAVAAGDPKGEEELIRRFRSRIQRKVEAALSDRSEVEDLSSEILQAVILSLRRGSFRGECALGTFVHAVAKNKIAEHLRRRRRVTTELKDDIPDPGPLPDDGVAREEAAMAVRRALTQLKPKYREVLYLYYYRGLSVGEIAERLGAPARRISEWKDYALKVLRAKFGPSLNRIR